MFSSLKDLTLAQQESFERKSTNNYSDITLNLRRNQNIYCCGNTVSATIGLDQGFFEALFHDFTLQIIQILQLQNFSERFHLGSVSTIKLTSYIIIFSYEHISCLINFLHRL